MQKLTQQEEAAMLAVWQTGPAFIGDFLEAHEAPKPHYNTLSSTIKKLEQKGYLSGRKRGAMIEYTPAVNQEDYKKKFMNNVVKNYFRNSYKDLVTFFAREKKISPEELNEIIELIKNKK